MLNTAPSRQIFLTLLMQFSLDSMEKSRFFAEGKLSNLSESFLVVGVTFLDKTYLKMRADFLLINHQPISVPS